MLENKFLNQIFKKSMMLLLFFVSIAIFLSLLTFNPDDPGWGVVSLKESSNILGGAGSWISSLIIREFGLIPGFLLCFVLFIWSLKLFNSSIVKYFKLKVLSLILFVVLGSLSDAYLELLITKYISFQNSSYFQEGYSDWIFTLFSKNISSLLEISEISSSLILGISSTIISLVLFFWISSLGPAEKQFFKFIAAPLIKPLLWLSTIFYNLFFGVQNNEQEIASNKFSNWIVNFKNKFFKIIPDDPFPGSQTTLSFELSKEIVSTNFAI